MSRNDTIYVSGYQDREVVLRWGRRSKRTVTVDFNGAMAADRTIASVTVRAWTGYPAYLSDLAIDGRKVTFLASAQQSGTSLLRCDATLDNGDIITQTMSIEVDPRYWFNGESPVSTGPTSLTVNA